MISAKTTGVLALLSACYATAANQLVDGIWRSQGWGLVYEIRGGNLQAFEVTTSAKVGKNNHFESTVAGAGKALQLKTDFIPFNFSAHGKAAGGAGALGAGREVSAARTCRRLGQPFLAT